MSTFTEQFSAASKANFEAQLALINQFASKTFEGVEKLVELNLKAVKSTLEEGQDTAHKLFAAKDPQEFLSLTSAQAQPGVEKGIAYSRHFAGIVTGTQAELTKTAEAQLAEVNRKVISLIDEAAKNAPAGSENAISIVRSAIGNINAGYEHFSKSAKQAADALETNVSTAVDQLSQATIKATARTTKK